VLKFSKADRRWASVCLFLFLTIRVQAATNDVDRWVNQAISLGLDKSRTWEVLGHYRPRAAGWKSLIGDPNFFLAPKGNENPKAELVATINAWLDPQPTGRATNCASRFPARIAWLKNVLAVPANQIPEVADKNNFKLMQRISPHQAVLIYPAAAFKGLGAMFGHTLIRFDAEDPNPLISYSVSYAALSGKDNFFGFIKTIKLNQNRW
jgi:hypothetical protein